MIYGHDTGIFPKETWGHLIGTGVHIDYVSLDCTEGAYEDLPYEAHMCLGRNIKCRDLLIENKICDETTKFVLNHFSHNGKNVLYKDFSEIAKSENFEITYDGMEINF